MTAPPPLYACIEAGGTKFVVGVASGPNDMRDTIRIPTSEDSAATIAAVIDYLQQRGPFAGVGIASFGPIQLDTNKADWGVMLDTPKPGWRGVDMVKPFREALHCAVSIDTDVNGAALAEGLWGAGQGAGVLTYVTVGTGIGGGALIDGRPLHGLRHPEMGHMIPARHPLDERPGTCPYHGACLEGMASGSAIARRWGSPLSDLGADHPAHAITAHYLAQLVIAQQALLSPHRIILGGGVMHTPGLIDRVRSEVVVLGGGYFPLGRGCDSMIVSPALGDNAGLMGALALTMSRR